MRPRLRTLQRTWESVLCLTQPVLRQPKSLLQSMQRLQRWVLHPWQKRRASGLSQSLCHSGCLHCVEAIFFGCIKHNRDEHCQQVSLLRPAEMSLEWRD